MGELILNRLFLLVLSLSLSGTLTGLLIAVIRPFTQKYCSKRWNYYIWLLVVIRLILPFHLEPDFLGALNLHVAVSQYASPVQNSYKNVVDNTVLSTPSILTDTSDVHRNLANDSVVNVLEQDETELHIDPLSNTPNFISRFLMPVAYVWILGTAVALLIKMISYWQFQTRIKKDCVRIIDNSITVLENTFCTRLHIKNIPAIYKSTLLSSPMTIGLWKPVIIIPETFFIGNEYVFQLALHHELIHVARKDLLYKWIYQLLLCVHWFNPILYLIDRRINSDCELSCDEAILGQLNESGKQMYGNLLLDTAAQNTNCRQSALSMPLLENKKNLKKRLDHILHYKGITRFRLIISGCTLTMMLTFSACSSVSITSDKASASESSHSDADSDEPSLFSQILTSLVSSNGFMDTFSEPNQSRASWKVYDNDELIAGEDIQDNWGAYNYYGGGKKIHASSFVLYGSDSFLIAYADNDMDVEIKSSFDLSEGKFKIVSVAPDHSVVTLNDTGAETTQIITMKKGRNVLKQIGQWAKLKNMNIDFTNLKESKFEAVYFSEEEEYSTQVRDAIIMGKPFDKNKVVKSLPYMDKNDASEVFHALLTAKTAFTDDELCDFLVYSNAALSSEYLLEAMQAGTIEPLHADTVSQITFYLEGKCQTEVLKSLPVQEFYDVFAENIYYLNSSQIDECLTDYINRGGTLTYSMYDEISPYLNDSIRRKLDELLQ